MSSLNWFCIMLHSLLMVEENLGICLPFIWGLFLAVWEGHVYISRRRIAGSQERWYLISVWSKPFSKVTGSRPQIPSPHYQFKNNPPCTVAAIGLVLRISCPFCIHQTTSCECGLPLQPHWAPLPSLLGDNRGKLPLDLCPPFPIWQGRGLVLQLRGTFHEPLHSASLNIFSVSTGSVLLPLSLWFV